jgi:TonB-dependent receptor
MHQLDTQSPSAPVAGRALRNALLAGASVIATCSLPAAAFAQDAAPSTAGGASDEAAPAAATADQVGGGTSGTTTVDAVPADEIVITGVRASLQRASTIKRNSSGVVDAISAEDIGKFPDTNLAESLQRIPGVSINRVNGEGSQVTVRGFGPGYNLVTLNGRTLAATSVGVVGGDGNADGAQGTSRSFDFDNLASEGVRTLEVYKTGRAAIQSGGIGSTINVVTRRPLDTSVTGFNGSIGAKAVYDTSVNECIDCGRKVTPEVSGVVSWSDPNQTLGVSLFGSYQKRNFSTASSGGNGWNIVPYSTFLGFTTPTTKINNAPSSAATLVAVPNDSRSNFSELNRERINGQAVVQFRPTETLTITADALYAQNRQKERRSDSSNWFNRPFNEVTFDGDPVINTAVFLSETLSPTKDGPGSENQYRATKAKLRDTGLNVAWDLTDTFKLSLDGHTSKSQSLPDNPLGHTSTLVAMAGYGITSHTVDYSGKAPVMQFIFNDTAANGSTRQGNRNGTLDIGDIGSQVARSFTTTQTNRLNELRADAGWDLGGGSRFDFGTNFRDSKVRSTQVSTYQPLGDWGVANPGDVVALAPGQLFEFCLPCKFSNLDLKAQGDALKAYRVHDATELYSILSAAYPAPGAPGRADNRVREKVISTYGQVTWKGELGGAPAAIVAGLRYERTTSTSTSIQAVPESIRWDADNDFTVVQSTNAQALKVKSRYNNLLPSIDFRIEPMQNLVGRVSYSRTIARTDYSNLFSATNVGGPNRPTVGGGVPTASVGNPSLVPLESDNFDVSLEYYYKPDSYVSAGFFHKNVRNFVGAGITTESVFGLRDPSSGAAGTRSGLAVAELNRLGRPLNDVNLFALTALIDQRGSVAAASNEFQANYNNATNALNQAYVDTLFQNFNVTANASDPFYQFSVTRPINNRDAKVWGFELQGQHFFGDTGFGVSAAYTKVNGDISFDRGADPSVDQFALIGLSDTLNGTLIYEKYGVSARLAYNWRDQFLSQLNRDNYHNPVFTEPFGQLDFNLTYAVTPNLALSFEAINLTEEGIRQHIRTKRQVIFVQELQRRFMFGARYKFGGSAPAALAPAPAYAPPPLPPATQTCADGSVILATSTCPVVAPPPPPAAPVAGERG